MGLKLGLLVMTLAAAAIAAPASAQDQAHPAGQPAQQIPQATQATQTQTPQTTQTAQTTQAAPAEEQVLYENPYVRVRRTIYPAGKHLPLHSHKGRVVVFLSNGVVRTTTPDGKSHDMTFHRDMVYWSDPVTHTLDNVGGTTLDAIEVELLGPYPATPQAFAGDALRQAPANFKMIFVNDQVRVLHFSLGPHQSTPMHDHLDRIVVQLLPIHARITLPDGSQSEFNAPQDDARFESSVRHIVENLSDAPTEAISIELEPPQPKTPDQPKPRGRSQR